MEYREILKRLLKDESIFYVWNPISVETRELFDRFLRARGKENNKKAHLSFEELMLLGVDSYKNRRFDEAADFFKTALGIRPDSTIARLNAASVSEFTGDFDLAETLYVEAMKIDPENPRIISFYALFLKRCKKDFKTSEEYFMKSIELDGENPSILTNYALFLKEIKGDYEAANEYFKKAIDIDPICAGALGNYALFLREVKEDFNASETYFRKAIETDPHYAVALGNYALFLREAREDFDGAELYFRKAIEADPDNVAHLGNYAYLLYESEKYEEAIHIIDRLIALNPVDWVYFTKGHALLAMGRLKEAEEAYTKGLSSVDSFKRLEELINSDLSMMKEKGLIEEEGIKNIKHLLRISFLNTYKENIK